MTLETEAQILHRVGCVLWAFLSVYAPLEAVRWWRFFRQRRAGGGLTP